MIYLVLLSLILFCLGVFLVMKVYSLKTELDKKRAEIRALNRQRTDFVANVSHELKTPLTSIRGYTETLQDGAIENPEKAREFLKRIHDNTQRLDLLIHDILDLSRLEATDTHLSLEEVDLEKLFTGLRDLFAIRLEEKNQILRLQIQVKSILADRHLLEQAFSNLIANANRYCQNSAMIEIQAREISEEGHQWTLFEVIDNGPGIEEKALSRIFERFFRGDKSRSRALGGTGLGLAIVKHIILSHGGKVKVANRPSGGLCFSLTIPKNLKDRVLTSYQDTAFS